MSPSPQRPPHDPSAAPAPPDGTGEAPGKSGEGAESVLAAMKHRQQASRWVRTPIEPAE